jgi:L-serine dehydratase
MSFISAFDVMGPNMIGPSSSHTAGAARITFLARKMLNGTLKKVQFTLYGSFAKTYHGHGTDRALLGGIWNRRYENPRFFRDCKRHWT